MLKKSKKGFTILELVCVVSIIGIIGLITIPKMEGAQDQIKIASDTTSIRSINTCIAMYCTINDHENLLGQTSINVYRPIKDGDSAETIVQFLQDKGLLDDKAVIYFPTGHTYLAVENEVN
ncbi:MAG: prepilin-type N-terminal cleavage/methylation domain-containing protein [Candidatus Babeliales bacterium]|jgi:prepilin-type N-terminal cleavage/methylation domain-containing protein